MCLLGARGIPRKRPPARARASPSRTDEVWQAEGIAVAPLARMADVCYCGGEAVRNRQLALQAAMTDVRNRQLALQAAMTDVRNRLLAQHFGGGQVAVRDTKLGRSSLHRA